MCGFPVSLLSGGEVSLAMNGVIDYGFTGLTDLEWVVSRISQTSSIPLIADIEDGFGGPLAVYRAARRLSQMGAAAIQLEDAGDMENSNDLLPQNKYMAKIKAALEALKGTNCLLIARSNADPRDPAAMKEGCERLKEAMALGAHLAMMVRITNLEDAKKMAAVIPGWEIFADVRAVNGKPAVTMDELTALGFKMCSTHFALKAAMEAMLEHGRHLFAEQSVAYTFTHAQSTGIMDFSATPLYDPQSYMELEQSFSGKGKEYTLVGNPVQDFPAGYVRSCIKDRL
jgi:2-methylisocitrate lyase-like PEP mutase family enzyme